MFSKILVAVDGSPSSDRSLAYAFDIAKKYGGSIVLIHVVERPVYPYVYPPKGINFEGSALDMIKKAASRLLQEKKGELLNKGIKTDAILVVGDPAGEILKASEECDLIVMGSRGLGRAKILLLGSVSTKVSQHTTKPLLITRLE